MEDMATRGRDQSADPGPEWRAAQSRPVPLPFWRESGKSREREGSALALNELRPYDCADALVRQLRGPHLSTWL